MYLVLYIVYTCILCMYVLHMYSVNEFNYCIKYSVQLCDKKPNILYYYYGSMEGVSGVAETEWYLEVFTEAKGSEDGDLGDVLGGYWHLVVSLDIGQGPV